eukprot:CCRYP_000612-RA/>CCRYP_000612-RA protein AED:0.44 eAED:0.30 QI:0/0/0/1/0/0/4/0/510
MRPHPTPTSPSTITAKCERLKAKNETALGHWQTFQRMCCIAFNQVGKTINPIYYVELNHPNKGLNDVLVRDLLYNIRNRYCHNSQNEIDRNMDTSLKRIDPSLSLSIYTRKQENCQDFAAGTRVSISEATIVTTKTKHVIQCGNFTKAWKEWNRCPKADKTWPNWKTHLTCAFQENRDIQRLTGDTFHHQAHSTVKDEFSKKMLLSLDNLANAAIKKHDTVKNSDPLTVANTKLMEQVTRLQKQNTKLRYILESTLEGHREAAKHLHGQKAAMFFKKTLEENDITREPFIRTSWEAARSTSDGPQKPDCSNQQGQKHCCKNHSLGCRHTIHPGEHAVSPQTVLQLKGGRLLTTEDLLLLLSKLPPEARHAHRAPGISHDLVSAATLSDAGCELFFTKQNVRSLSMEILGGWRDQETRLWHISHIPDSGNNIVPPDQSLTHLHPQVNSIYKCESTSQLIHFYYATMGYPVISTWLKAINKGYFQGWRGLTSDGIRKFIMPSEHSQLGHMDQ